MIRSSPKNTSNTQVRKYRSTTEFEDRKKHFSSEPGLVGDLGNKKIMAPETCNMGRGKLCIKYMLCMHCY